MNADDNPVINTKLTLSSKVQVRTNVVIALDVSYSMIWPDGYEYKYNNAVSAIKKMINLFASQENVNVGFIMFSDDWYMGCDIQPAEDVASLSSMYKGTGYVQSLYDAGKGNTNYETALSQANTMLNDFTSKDSTKYKDNNAIILLTDGIATRSCTIVGAGGVTLGKGGLHATVDAIYKANQIKQQGTNIITIGYELGIGNSGATDESIKDEMTNPDNDYYIHSMTLDRVKELYAGQGVNYNTVLGIYNFLSDGANNQNITSSTEAQLACKRIADVALNEIASNNPNTNNPWFYKDVRENDSTCYDIATTLGQIANNMVTNVRLVDIIPKEMSIVTSSIKCPTGVRYSRTGNRITFKFDIRMLSPDKPLEFSFDTVLDIVYANKTVGFRSGDIIYTNGSSIKQNSTSDTLGSSYFEYEGSRLNLTSPTLLLVIQFDVILHPNRGVLKPSANITSYDFGYEKALPKPPDIYMQNPNYEGYEFVGWFEGGGKLSSKIEVPSKGKKEYWAKWAKIERDDQANEYYLITGRNKELLRKAAFDFEISTINAPTSSGGVSKRKWTVNFTGGNSGTAVGKVTKNKVTINKGSTGYILDECVTYNCTDISNDIVNSQESVIITAVQNKNSTDENLNYTITTRIPVRKIGIFREH